MSRPPRHLPDEAEIARLFADDQAVSKQGMRDLLGRFRAFSVHDGAVRALDERLVAALDVRDFGAVGDGASDDSEALEAALARAALQGGGLVLFGDRQRRYRLRRPLRVGHGVVLFGHGALLYAREEDDLFTLVELDGRGLRLEGLRFANGRSSAAGNVVRLLEGSRDVQITGCDFSGGDAAIPGFFPLRGIACDSAGIRRVVIERCAFTRLKYGVLVTTGAEDIEELTVAHSTFDAIATDAVNFNLPGTPYEPGNRLLVIGNHIRVPPGVTTDRALLEAGGFGVALAGTTQVSVVANTIEARLQGVHIEDECRHVAVIANTIRPPERAEPAAPYAPNAIHCLDGDHLTITGNQIAGSLEDGILLAFIAQGWGLRHAVISGNTLSGCRRNGIFLGDTRQRRLIVSDNIIDRCGAGMTLAGGGSALALRGNCLSDNGVALRIAGGVAGFLWRDNILAGNAADILIDEDQGPVALGSLHRVAESTAEALSLALADLGRFASGTMSVAMRMLEPPHLHRLDLIELSWDGRTLELDIVRDLYEGVFDFPAYRMRGSVLEIVDGKNAGVLPPLAVTLQLDGRLVLG